MPTTKTTVMNRALANIGQISPQLIEDPDDNENEDVRKINRFYAQTLDAFLEEADWSWATKYATLALDSSTPPEHWVYAYVMPADSVSPRRLVGYSPEDKVEFEEGRTDAGVHVLWTDRQDVSLEYTARVENFNAWSPQAVEALALKLALDMAPAYTGGIKKLQVLSARYEDALEKAIVMSHNRQERRWEDHNEFIDERHGVSPRDKRPTYKPQA